MAKKYPPVPGVYVEESPIHGKGCFAARPFKKGEVIGFYEGPPSDKDGTYVLWVSQEDGSWKGIDGKNDLRYLNHKKKCNAEFDGNRLVAIKAIRTNQEITFHYGEEWEDIP